MATVELGFSALPSHVRTARLVTAAVARRAGLDEELLDELRFAVGEACARAVSLHREHAPETPVRLELSEGDGHLVVAVLDAAPGAAATLDLGALESTELDPGDDGGALGLAIVAGLVDDVTVAGHEDGSPGTRVTMRWPLSPSAPGLPAAGTGRATAAAVHQDDTAL